MRLPVYHKSQETKSKYFNRRCVAKGSEWGAIIPSDSCRLSYRQNSLGYLSLDPEIWGRLLSLPSSLDRH